MNRNDIQLIASARSGNQASRYEAGRKYLSGAEGFPRHVRLGLEYLSNLDVARKPVADRAIAESLTLEELVEHRQLSALEAASTLEMTPELLNKLCVWTAINGVRYERGVPRLRAAARAGNSLASKAMAVRDQGGPELAEFLRADAHVDPSEIHRILLLSAQEMASEDDLISLTRCVGAMIHSGMPPTSETAELVLRVFELAENRGIQVLGLPTDAVQRALEFKCSPGDYSAALLVGRALCGIDSGSIHHSAVVQSTNFRRGAAMLMRAADSGRSEAWSYLYKVHAGGAALGNTQLALYFLEKAAGHGDVVAQRLLGISILKEAVALNQLEEGMRWLVRAVRAGDASAASVAKTFVLPVAGSEHEADAALVDLWRTAPKLAARLELARTFGLTKREALTVDPAAGRRDWGLVVDQHPFLQQRRLSGPRAIPAATEAAAARLFALGDILKPGVPYGPASSGELKQRADAVRYALARHRVDERLFFAQVDSTALERLKSGPKWAVRFGDVISRNTGG